MLPRSPQNCDKKTPWPSSVNELCRSKNLRLSAKLVPTSADIRCRVVIATDLHGHILGFLDRPQNCDSYIIIRIHTIVKYDPINNRGELSSLSLRSHTMHFYNCEVPRADSRYEFRLCH
jgi:hypothetical protein